MITFPPQFELNDMNLIPLKDMIMKMMPERYEDEDMKMTTFPPQFELKDMKRRQEEEQRAHADTIERQKAER